MPSVTAVDICIFRVGAGAVDREWVMHVLNSGHVRAVIESLQSGTTRKRVSGSSLKDLDIPIAPINEQRRIVEKIDELFSLIEAGEQALVRAKKLLERYRQSVLNAAVTGELTKDWRERHQGEIESGEGLLKRILKARREAWEKAELAKMHARGKPPTNDRWKQKYKDPQPPDTSTLPDLPDGWTWASPDQISAVVSNALAIGPFGSNLKVSDYKAKGVPLVFVRHIRTGNFQGLDLKFITKEKAKELSAHRVMEGDLLITKMGEPPGDACLYPLQAPEAIITADCIKITVSKLIPEAGFLVYAIGSNVGASQIDTMTTGVAQQKISLDRFRRFAFPIPSTEEFAVIIDHVEQALSIRSLAYEALVHSAEGLSRLRQSILAAAFSGKLIPQDPADEPASVLLERVREQRSSAVLKAGRRLPSRRDRPSKERETAMTLTRKEVKPTHLRDILRAGNGTMEAGSLWKASDLDIGDFYKQLRDELAAGHLREDREGEISKIICL